MPADPKAGEVAAPVIEPATPSSEGEIQSEAPARRDPRKLLAMTDVPQEVIDEAFGQEQQPELPISPKEEEKKEDVPQGTKDQTAQAEPETAEPPAETPEPQKPDGEEDEEEDGEEDISASNQQQVSKTTFDKRIGKLTRQKIRLRDRVEELEGELESAKSELEKSQVTPAPTFRDPLADVTDLDKLKVKVFQAKTMRSWCRRNVNGAVLNEGKENEQQIGPEQVAEWMDHYDSVIESAPDKREQLKAKSEWDKVARNAFPVIFDRKTEEYQVAQQLVRELPELTKLPDMNVRIGIYLLGLREFNKAVAKAQKGSAANNGESVIPKSPPIAPATPKRPSSAVTPSRNNQVEDATKEVLESGADPRSLVKLVAAHRAGRAAPGGKTPALS